MPHSQASRVSYAALILLCLFGSNAAIERTSTSLANQLGCGSVTESSQCVQIRTALYVVANAALVWRVLAGKNEEFAASQECVKKLTDLTGLRIE